MDQETQKGWEFLLQDRMSLFWKAQWSLGPTVKLEKTVLTSDIICKFEAFPESAWSFIVHWKEIAELTTTIILIIMVYCRERIQIKIRQGKKCIEQSPGEVPGAELPFSFPYEVRTHYSLGIDLW